MERDLMDLETSLADIDESFSNAINRLDDIDIACEGQWPEIKRLKRRLSGLHNAFLAPMPKGIQSAIDGARAEYERLSDLADAHSY